MCNEGRVSDWIEDAPFLSPSLPRSSTAPQFVKMADAEQVSLTGAAHRNGPTIGA